MQKIEIYFDGYCPESSLKDKQVEMRLNEDDFWESEETGLQIAVFPPYANILRWRGKGKFRQSSDVASNVFSGLIMTESLEEPSKEIFPNEKKLLVNRYHLKSYISNI